MQRIDRTQLYLDFGTQESPPKVGRGEDRRKNFSLFIWWIDRYAWPEEVAALILGVHVESIRRWGRLRCVPRHAAMAIDQAIRGPIVQGGLWRGAIAWRHDWREPRRAP